MLPSSAFSGMSCVVIVMVCFAALALRVMPSMLFVCLTDIFVTVGCVLLSELWMLCL